MDPDELKKAVGVLWKRNHSSIYHSTRNAFKDELGDDEASVCVAVKFDHAGLINMQFGHAWPPFACAISARIMLQAKKQAAAATMGKKADFYAMFGLTAK